MLSFGNPHYCSGTSSPTTIDNGAILNIYFSWVYIVNFSSKKFNSINVLFCIKATKIVAFLLFFAKKKDLKLW